MNTSQLVPSCVARTKRVVAKEYFRILCKHCYYCGKGVGNKERVQRQLYESRIGGLGSKRPFQIKGEQPSIEAQNKSRHTIG